MDDDRKYTIKPGDTLSAIAAHFYGEATDENVAKLFDANKDKEGVGPTPNEIRAGIVIDIPDGDYTVQPGDTFGSIAAKVYGSADRQNVERLFQANKDKDGVGSTPNDLKAGAVLVIPRWQRHQPTP